MPLWEYSKSKAELSGNLPTSSRDMDGSKYSTVITRSFTMSVGSGGVRRQLAVVVVAVEEEEKRSDRLLIGIWNNSTVGMLGFDIHSRGNHVESHSLNSIQILVFQYKNIYF